MGRNSSRKQRTSFGRVNGPLSPLGLRAQLTVRLYRPESHSLVNRDDSPDSFHCNIISRSTIPQHRVERSCRAFFLSVPFSTHPISTFSSKHQSCYIAAVPVTIGHNLLVLGTKATEIVIRESVSENRGVQGS